MEKKLPILLLTLLFIGAFSNSNLFVYPVMAGGFLYNMLASAIILYSGALLLVSDSPVSFKITHSKLFFAAFGVYVLLQALLTNTGHSRHTYFILSTLLYFSLTWLFSNTSFSFRWLFTAITGIAIFESVICIAQYFGVVASFNSYFKVTGTYANPNVTAMFLAIALPAIGFTLNLFKRERLVTGFSLIFWGKVLLVACVVVALLLLKCRTAYIGACVATMVMLSVRYNLRKRLTSKHNRVFAIAIIVLLVGLVIPVIQSVYHDKQASADGRKLVWKVSLPMILEKPFGFGYGQFEQAYNLHQAAYFEKGSYTEKEEYNAAYVNMAYNEPLEHAVEGGVIGLLTFVALMISLIAQYANMTIRQYADVPMGKSIPRATKKANHNTYENLNLNPTSVAYAGVCAIAAMSLVNFTFQAPPVLALFVVYAAILSSAGSTSGAHVYKLNHWSKVTLAVAIAFAALYLGGKQAILAYAQLQNKKGSVTQANANVAGALRIYEPLAATLQWSETYHQNYAAALMRTGNDSLALKHLLVATNIVSEPDLYMTIGHLHIKHGKMAEAEAKFRIAMFTEPNRFAPRYALMRLYQQCRDTVRALDMARGILHLKPKVPSSEVSHYKREAGFLINHLTREETTYSTIPLKTGNKLINSAAQVTPPFEGGLGGKNE